MVTWFGSVPDANYTWLRDVQVTEFPPSCTPNEPSPRIGSMLHALSINPKAQQSTYMVKVAGMETLFDSIESNITVFLPIDSSHRQVINMFMNMGRGLATRILNRSSITTKVSPDLMRNNGIFITPGRDRNLTHVNATGRQIFVEDVPIISMVECDNGIIYFTRELLPLNTEM